MPCNVDSTLTKFKIGGHVEDLCGDDIAVRVELRLVAPNGATDPSNSAVFAMKPYNVTFDDGCWCTCEIPANTSTVDNDLAIFPNDTYYQLRITAAGQTIVDEQLYITLEDIQALTPIDTGGACGVVYDINDLRPLLPSTPPTDAFAAAVEDVLAGLALGDGGPYSVDESVPGQVTVTDDTSGESFTFAAGADDVNTITGSGVPPAALGVDGAYYVDIDTGETYGPKAGGVWPTDPVPDPDDVEIVASAPITAGQLVNIFDNAGTVSVRPADNTLDQPADGWATVTAAAGAATVIVAHGVIEGLAGLTPGAEYWLAANGAVVNTPTTTAGELRQYIGKAISATSILTLISLPTTVA